MTALVEPPASDDIVIAEPRLRSLIRHVVTTVWLLPSAALLIGLFLIPVGYAIYLGFTNLELLGQYAQTYSFTGLANLQRMIHDPTFWYSVKLTLIFVIGSGIIAQTVLGLGLALLAQRVNVVVRSSVGAIVILAWVLPEITVAFVWYSFSQAGGHAQPYLRHPEERPAFHPAHARGLPGQRVAWHGLLDAAAQRGPAQCSRRGR